MKQVVLHILRKMQMLNCKKTLLEALERHSLQPAQNFYFPMQKEIAAIYGRKRQVRNNN